MFTVYRMWFCILTIFISKSMCSTIETYWRKFAYTGPVTFNYYRLIPNSSVIRCISACWPLYHWDQIYFQGKDCYCLAPVYEKAEHVSGTVTTNRAFLTSYHDVTSCSQKGYTLFRDQRYCLKLFVYNYQNVMNAESTCRQDGGHLVSVYTQQDLNNLKALFSNRVTKYSNDNVAFGKETTQSSTEHGGLSSYAVDGNTNNDFDQKSCTHTGNLGINWWCVDLQKDIDFVNINIYNRNVGRERLQGFEIRLSSNGGFNAQGYTESTVCYKDTSSSQPDIYKIDSCNQPEVQFNGRYVYISIPRPYLTLCEVEIFESKDNVAFGKETTQSSTEHGGLSSYAVDGNTNNDYDKKSCTHTGNLGINWWCVDLQSDIDLQNINIYNRDVGRERLQGFEIRLSSNGGCNANGYTQSTLCYKDTSSSQPEIYKIDSCNQPEVQFNGRYVYISIPRPYLTLCEVEIFENNQFYVGAHRTLDGTEMVWITGGIVDKSFWHFGSLGGDKDCAYGSGWKFVNSNCLTQYRFICQLLTF